MDLITYAVALLAVVEGRMTETAAPRNGDRWETGALGSYDIVNPANESGIGPAPARRRAGAGTERGLAGLRGALSRAA